MIFLLLLGCGEEDTASLAQKEAINYYEDVRPVLAQHCVRCHSSGGQGPGDFLNPEEAAPLADLMIASIDAGTMPPPASDPSCHDYQGADYLFIPEEKREIIRSWAEQGAPIGPKDKALSIDHLLMETEIEDPDLVVKIQEPYAPTFQDDRNPGNEYRCFALEHGQEEPFYITALHPIIDTPSLVHHIVLAKSREDGLVSGSKDLEGANCINNGAFITDFRSGAMLGGWAPGMQPIRLPEGAGILVQPDEYIVIQMHYYQGSNSEGATDQSAYAFETTDTVEHTLQMFPMGTQDFTIPAGDPSYTQTSSIGLPMNLKIWGVFPHMHILGSEYHSCLEHEDGSQTCLARSDHYDFYNQLQYIFRKEEEFSKHDTMKVSCTWNNAAENPNLIHNPPIDIGYGERTDEEMCYVFTMVSFD